MKINDRNPRIKLPRIAAGLVLLVLLCISGYVLYNHYNQQTAPNTDINYDPPTKDQQKQGQQTKKETLDDTESKPLSNSDDTTQPTGSSVPLMITAANQNNAALQVRATIDTVTSDGSCVISVSSPGKTTYTATAAVQAQANFSACAGFDVPLDSLSPGNWNVTISYSSTQYKGTATKDVVIQ